MSNRNLLELLSQQLPNQSKSQNRLQNLLKMEKCSDSQNIDDNKMKLVLTSFTFW